MGMDELMAITLIAMVFVGLPLVWTYIWFLTRFFKELRDKDNNLWKKIGSPTLPNMLFLPFINFRKFYSFFSTLKECCHHPDYKYAGIAYALLFIGLVYVVLLFAVTVGLILSL